MHCGSTSLAHYLASHPQLSYGTEKEHRFFPHSVSETWEDYAVQFTMRSPTALAPKYGFDFTPGYLSKSAQDRKVIAQIAEMMPPSTKFIVILKSPLAFALSRFSPAQLAHCHLPSRCASDVLRMACQDAQLIPWFETFGRARFFMLRSEDLARAAGRQELLSSIHRFLGIQEYVHDSAAIGHGSELNVNVSQRREWGDPPLELDAALLSALARCGHRLSALTGFDFQPVEKFETVGAV